MRIAPKTTKTPSRTKSRGSSTPGRKLKGRLARPIAPSLPKHHQPLHRTSAYLGGEGSPGVASYSQSARPFEGTRSSSFEGAPVPPMIRGPNKPQR